MRILLLLLVALAVGGGVFYVMSGQQQATLVKVQDSQNSAQDKADAYKKNQEDMMKQLGQ